MHADQCFTMTCEAQSLASADVHISQEAPVSGMAFDDTGSSLKTRDGSIKGDRAAQ